jgi:hypothetical protein
MACAIVTWFVLNAVPERFMPNTHILSVFDTKFKKMPIVVFGGTITKKAKWYINMGHKNLADLVGKFGMFTMEYAPPAAEPLELRTRLARVLIDSVIIESGTPSVQKQTILNPMVLALLE